MNDRLAIRMAAGSGPTFGVDDLACAAATDLGFWNDEGLDVTWTPVHGGVAAIQAVLDGRVDVSYGGLGPVLRLTPIVFLAGCFRPFFREHGHR